MSSLVLQSNVLFAFAAAAILCLIPELWFCRSGRLRTIVTLAAWTIACFDIALNALARPIYCDEVFYMTQAFEAHRGAPFSLPPNACLPSWTKRQSPAGNAGGSPALLHEFEIGLERRGTLGTRFTGFNDQAVLAGRHTRQR